MSQIEALAESVFSAVKEWSTSEFDKRSALVLSDCLKRCSEEIVLRVEALADQVHDGKDGRDGVDGKDGAPGPQGERGERGEQGEKGDLGEKGERGEKGDIGAQGARGEKGEQGERGQPGEKGDTGEKGERGERGEKGEQGERGEQGAQGERGEQGIQGAQGERGPAGSDGREGAPGAKGEDGRDGRDGKEGPPGRDALRLDVLDAIDSERSYARGTFARHEGGLIRSVRATDPITDGDIARAGWQLVVNGLADFGIEKRVEDGRVVVRHFMRSTEGRTAEFEWTVPGNRGVWRDDKRYMLGDYVTWGGSQWHCEAEDTKEKPGEGCADWSLAVKSGRDAKPPRVKLNGGTH